MKPSSERQTIELIALPFPTQIRFFNNKQHGLLRNRKHCILIHYVGFCFLRMAFQAILDPGIRLTRGCEKWQLIYT